MNKKNRTNDTISYKHWLIYPQRERGGGTPKQTTFVNNYIAINNGVFYRNI